MEIRIETSGWHYKHWKGVFYPKNLQESEMLSFYIRHFDTVELNNTFYRLPDKQAVKNWQIQTPQGFLFSVKGSRYITHLKKLKDPEEPFENFYAHVKLLKHKLGPIIFQLPPKWRCNIERLESFLNILPGNIRYAFEFRDTSWHCPEVYEMLKKNNSAFCLYDIRGFESPVIITSDFTYIRLHGPSERAYEGKYTKTDLIKWINLIRESEKKLKAVYIYFDNDQRGYAVENALELKELIKSH